jgi:hypothetical protein
MRTFFAGTLHRLIPDRSPAERRRTIDEEISAAWERTSLEGIGELWSDILHHFQRTGEWSDKYFGPRPGQPGCVRRLCSQNTVSPAGRRRDRAPDSAIVITTRPKGARP